MASTSGSTPTPRVHYQQKRQHGHNHLPPSPPPSPQQAHTSRRRRKRADSYAQLAAATPLPSPITSPGPEWTTEKEPLWKQLILTPFICISFLLSLFLVNHHNRVWRSAAHPAAASSSSRNPTTLLSSLSLLPARWLDPEPYQQVDSTWAQRSAAGTPEDVGATNVMHGGELKRRGGERRKWHLNRKIRKMARLEVGDAFAVQDKVMVCMGVVGVVACGAVWLVAMWAWGVAVS